MLVSVKQMNPEELKDCIFAIVAMAVVMLTIELMLRRKP